MLADAVCDTTPMKPLGRAVRIPPVTPSLNTGALTGIVYQRETGDALARAAVGIVLAADASRGNYSEHYTDDQGGFTFDSVAPGRYRVRIRRISEYVDSASYEAVSGRVDTLQIAMRAYRCSGY